MRLVLSLLLSFLAVFWVIKCKHSFLFFLIDYPNHRSLHQMPIARTGGLAILCGILVGILCISSASFIKDWAISGGVLLLVIVSLVDDYKHVAARWRLITHLLAGYLLLVSELVVNKIEFSEWELTLPFWIIPVLTIIFTVWMINLYNFMDGMDGFAGGMAVIGFSTLAWLGRADADFANFCLVVAAASAGFLVHNFPPAKIFMGDTGSTTLGFLVAACSLGGSKAGLFPLWVALLVFSPFIVDATVTLLRRLFQGEKIWEAHRTHYYQRLVLLGWGHRRTVLAEYVLMLACAGSAIGAVALPPLGQASLLIVWVLIYLLLMAGVERLERRATVAPP